MIKKVLIARICHIYVEPKKEELFYFEVFFILHIYKKYSIKVNIKVTSTYHLQYAQKVSCMCSYTNRSRGGHTRY